MSLIITNGLGRVGDGTKSALLSTMGYGSAGLPEEGTCLGVRLLSVVNYGAYLLLAFSNHLAPSSNVFEPESWSIRAGQEGDLKIPEVKAVSQPESNALKVELAEQSLDKAYYVILPRIGILDASGNHFDGPFEGYFVGFGEGPRILIVRSIDETTINVIFTEEVNVGDALTPTNYTVSDGIEVHSVARVTNSSYLLTTSKQNVSHLYAIEIQNIRDTTGNLVSH